MSVSINQDSIDSAVTTKQDSLCKTPSMFFPPDFVLDDAKLCAKLVNYAYDQCSQWVNQGYPSKENFKWTVPSDISGSYPLWAYVQELKVMSNWEPFGFVYCDGDGNAFVSFRGTITNQDQYNDMYFSLTPYSLVKEPNFGQVHWGFYSIYESISSNLLKALKDANTSVSIRKIYFTGHSLGSGLCTLSMPDVIYNFANKINLEPQQLLLYNFASPRVGDYQFACSINNSMNNSQIYRIVNTEDIVPTLPLSTVPYGYIYEHIGQQITFTAQYLSIDKNHSMANCYTYAINNPSQPQQEKQLIALDKPVLVLHKALSENFSVSVVDAHSS